MRLSEKKMVLYFWVIFAIPLIISCSLSEEVKLSGYRFLKESAIIYSNESKGLIGDLTVDMYIKLHNYPNTYTNIISKFEDTRISEFNLRIFDKENAQWSFGSGEKSYILRWNTSEVLPLNQWVRLTATRSMSERRLSLYINGILVSSRVFKDFGLASETCSDIILMARKKNTLDASLAELRIWEKTLTSAEIRETRKVIKKPSKQKSLWGYWRFYFIDIDKVNDLSGNNRSLIISKVN